MKFVYGLLTATVAIILAEIFGNYGLGDLVKDLITRLFGRAKSLVEAQVKRLEVELNKVRAKL